MPEDNVTVAALKSELALRHRQLDAIATVTAAVYAAADLGDLIRQALEVCLEVADCEAGSIILYNSDSEKLVFEHVVGPKAADLLGMEMPASQGIAGRVFGSGELEISDDVQGDPGHYRKVGEDLSYLTRTMVTLPMKQADGEIIGVMQVLNRRSGPFTAEDLDVLAIVSNQAAMAIDNARLHHEARLGQIVKLIGDIAHDVKNFMTPVESGVKTLQMLFDAGMNDLDKALSEACDDSHSEVRRQVEATLATLREFFPEVVQMVLDGSSSVTARAREIADCIKGEVAEPRFESADVTEVIDSVATVLRMVAERNDVLLNTDGVQPVPRLPIDRKLIHSAVYNLVNNAIPETPAGGCISVSTRAVEEGEWPDGGYVQIIVRDTGRGMPEHIRKRLFTKDVESTKPGGTGLGTRIVKNAVDAHGGRISVDSELGVGSTFTVHLPLSRPEPLQ